MHVGVWLSPADWRLKGDSQIARYNSDISKTKKCDNKSAGEKKKYWLSPAKLIFERNEDQRDLSSPIMHYIFSSLIYTGNCGGFSY